MRNKITSRSLIALAIVTVVAVSLVISWDRYASGIAAQGTPSCVAPPSGLVSWWPGEGNANDIIDSNSGTLSGGAFFSAAKAGQGFTFDSDDDRITIPHNANLNINSTGFTAEFWMRGVKNQPQAVYNLVEKSHGFIDSTGWSFQGTSATGTVGFGVGAGGPGSTNFPGVGTGIDVLDGNFHHIAGTWDGANIRLYVDGVLQGATPLATPFNNTRAVNIGFAAGGGSPQRFFRGGVDELAIYNRALSTSEIQAIVNAGSAGKCKPTCVTPPSGLVSWWPGEGNANDIIDSNSGTLSGGAFFSAAKVGQGFTFDSDDDRVTIPHNNNLNINSTGFTAEFWMRGVKNQPQAVYNLVEKSHGFIDSTGWSFQGTSATGTVGFGVGAGGPGSTNFPGVGTGIDVLDGNFHHIAGTWDGANIRLYVDGVLQGATPLSSPFNNTRTVNIGFAAGGGSPQRFFRGKVDEVEIYSRALTASEIQSIFNAGSAGKCKPDSDGDGVTNALDACPGTPAGTLVDESGCPVMPCPPPPTGWNFSERFNSAFDNTWAAQPGALPNAFGITYIGAPSHTFETVQSRQTLRMTNTLNDRQRVGFVTNSVLLGATGRLEARINTLIQDSTRIDGLFELWLVNATDPNKWVRATLFGSNFSTQRRWDVESSLGNYFAVQINYANNTWYRLRIDAFPGSLRASLWNDSGTVQIAGYTFTHDLAALGSNFRIGISQWMGIPGSPFITDVAVDYVRASPAVVANAGPDQTVECQGAQTTVTLNGAASCDPDGDPLTFEWREGSTLLGTGQTLPVNLGLGTHTITLTVTDPGGASSQDTVIINVVDTTRPTITAPPAVSVSTGPSATGCGTVISDATLGNATASDNCGSATITRSGVPAGNFFPVGTTYITYTANDGRGNTAIATQAITVTDTTPPAPDLATLPDVTGQCSATISAAPTATDYCRGSVTGTTSDPLSYTSQGTFIVTWTYNDGNGNTSTQTQKVIVKDTIAPTITTANKIVNTDPNLCSAVVAHGTTASDNCALASLAGVRSDGAALTNPYPKGTTTISWTATDQAGNTSTATQTITVIDNQNPVIACPAPISVVGNIPGSCGASVSVVAPAAADNCGATVSGSRSDSQALSAPYPLGVTTITWTATDAAGNQTSCQQQVTVTNPSPVVAITGPASGSVYAVGTTVNFTGTFTDNAGGTHTATWSFDAIIQTGQTGMMNEMTGAVMATYTFTSAGVYQVTLTVADGCGGSGSADTIEGLSALVVIYDPGAGWVTGGGWINSPAGAYAPNPSLIGKANFGFVSKYQNGASVPTGNTEFHFKAGDLKFKSTSYEWMVIAGKKAQYKGFGTINGSGNYRFMLTAIDGQQPGGGGQDKFRIRIWSDGGGLVYDNQMNDPDSNDPTTVLGGGSIVIHK